MDSGLRRNDERLNKSAFPYFTIAAYSMFLNSIRV